MIGREDGADGAGDLSLDVAVATAEYAGSEAVFVDILDPDGDKRTTDNPASGLLFLPCAVEYLTPFAESSRYPDAAAAAPAAAAPEPVHLDTILTAAPVASTKFLSGSGKGSAAAGGAGTAGATKPPTSAA